MGRKINLRRDEAIYLAEQIESKLKERASRSGKSKMKKNVPNKYENDLQLLKLAVRKIKRNSGGKLDPKETIRDLFNEYFKDTKDRNQILANKRKQHERNHNEHISGPQCVIYVSEEVRDKLKEKTSDKYESIDAFLRMQLRIK